MTRPRRRLTWTLAAVAAAVLVAVAALLWRLPFELWHLRQLDARDPATREAALDALVTLRSTRGAAAYFERWIATVGDSEPRFPVFGVEPPPEGWRWLVRFGPAAAPALEAGLRAERASVRRWAASLLGHLGTKATSAGRALLAALGDVDASVRELAALALGRACLNDRQLLEECAALVVDARQAMPAREAALAALVAAVEAYQKLREDAEDAVVSPIRSAGWEELHSLSPEILLESGASHRELLMHSLERAATCDVPRLRATALLHVCLLTVRRDEDEVPQAPDFVKALIHRGLNDADEAVQLTALQVIRAAQPLPQEALARAWKLLPRLARVGEHVEQATRNMLLEIPEPWPPEAWAGLATCLRDPDLVHFNYAERFHGESEPAMDLLRDALAGDSTVARENALAIVDDLPLASTLVARLWEPVLRTLEDEHALLADAAIAPASRIARTGTVEPRLLLDLLRSDRVEVRRRAATVLGAATWETGVVGPPLRAAAAAEVDVGLRAELERQLAKPQARAE